MLHLTFARHAGLVLVIGAALLTANAQAANPTEFVAPAPELIQGQWLNTEGGKPLTLAGLKGKVTVLHFWTFGCINCLRNIPAYERWQKRFVGRDVTFVGIHTPETARERKPENVERETKKLGITYPVLIDGETKNWREWGQQWWPTVYLLDRKGRIRYRWEGELEWQNAGGERWMGNAIDRLLRERK